MNGDNLTLGEVARAYLEICDEECSGDCSVGLPNCRFYLEPDVNADGSYYPGGCRLKNYCQKAEDEKE